MAGGSTGLCKLGCPSTMQKRPDELDSPREPVENGLDCPRGLASVAVNGKMQWRFEDETASRVLPWAVPWHAADAPAKRTNDVASCNDKHGKALCCRLEHKACYHG